MPRGSPTRLISIRIPEDIASETEKKAEAKGTTLREEIQRIITGILSREATMSQISVKTTTADKIPATARERLKLPSNSTEPVEVYRMYRSPQDIAIREAIAQDLAEAFEREVAEGKA